MVTPSYTFFFNKFSIGFGFSRKSGERTRISGCTSNHVCYDDGSGLDQVDRLVGNTTSTTKYDISDVQAVQQLPHCQRNYFLSNVKI